MKQKQFQEFVIESLTSLKDDVSSLNIRMTEQEKFQEFAVKHLMNQSEDIKSIKGSIARIEGRMDKIEGRMDRIEVRMENEIINKLQVLFDGHKQHEDRLNRIEKVIAG